MTSNQADLRARLSAMTIGQENASLTFADRLARENRWTLEFSLRVIEEYKRFIFLAATGEPGHSVTPSDAVDQAWHLHLTYTRDYWDIMCGTILDRTLHHGPTTGGDLQSALYREQYKETIARYEDVFGAVPSDIWPDAQVRFSGSWRRVDTQRHMVISKTRASFLAVIPGTLLLAACAPEELIFNITGMSMIEFGFAVGVAGLFLYSVIFRSRNNSKNDSGGCSTNSCGGGDDGGCGGCGD